jgi:hypothetical protein
VSIGIHLDTSTLPLSIGGLTATTSDTTDASSSTAVQGATIIVKGVNGKTAAPGSSGSESGNGASPTIQALQREIAQLQKLLKLQEQALHAATERNKGTDLASMAEISALQSAVTTTNGQLMVAVNALAAALLAEGNASSGSLVRASA